MYKIMILMLTMVGCGAGGLGMATGDVESPAPDLLREPAPDMLRVSVPDLGGVPTSPDMLTSPTPDLLTAPAPDMTTCGRFGEVCCNFKCNGSMICLVEGETCGEQTAHTCTLVGMWGCGTLNAPPCDDAGNPSTAGRCKAGLRVRLNQAGGADCVPCA